MLRLRPYKVSDARAITAWIKSEYELRKWAADRYETYPITAEDMNEYYDKEKENPNLWAMTAFHEAGVVGHFTMRFVDDKREEMRFGFVIVNPEERGKGYGKEMLSLGICYAFDLIKVDKISLAVFENNKAAVNCYTSCGFEIVDEGKQEPFYCMGEVWESFGMEIRKK